MGTIAIDTKTTPSQKSDIASLMNTLNILPSQKARSSRKGSFSKIMNEKTHPVPVASGKNKKGLPVIKAESAQEPKSKPETTDTTAEKKAAETAQKMKQAVVVPLLTLPGKKEPVKAGLNEPAVPEKAKDTPPSNTPVVDAEFAGVPTLTAPMPVGEKSARIIGALEPPQVTNPATGAEKTLPTRDFISPPDKKNITPAVDTANPVNPTLEESLLTAERPPKGENVKKPETAFMDRVADILRQKDDSPAPEAILSQIRRTVITRQDERQPHALLRDITAAGEMQKPVPAPGDVNDRGATIKTTAPEIGESAELFHKAVNMKDAAVKVTESAIDSERSRNTTMMNQTRFTEREALPFRTDASNIQIMSENKTSASDGSTGIRIQTVIDQITDAKQTMGNDFGRVRIVLDPPNLGTVDLDIVLRKDHVGVVMTAENASVQQILQAHADDIRSALQRQDLRIETFQVLLQDNGVGQQYAQSGAMFEQHGGQPPRQDVPVRVPIPADSPSNEGPASARGLISVFA